MLVNIFGLFFMVILVLLLVWAAFRARRARNSLLKWGGMVLSGLLALVLLALSAVTLTGLVKFYSRVNTPVPNLQVAGTSEQVQRGEHIANAFCASCHSTTGEIPLAGGVDLGKDFPAPLGRYVSVNLTPAGHLQNWSDGEIFRAIRNGIDRNGRKLVIMGNFRGRHLSDEDVQALIAYLRSQPAVQNETLDPPDQPNLMALVMFGAGLIPAAAPPTTASIEAPPKAPTQEYGAYLLSYQDCRDCHGEDLNGGKAGQLPPIGPNLKVVRGWTQEQFITTLRTGVDPGGHALSSQMPWQNIGRLDDEELAAMYLYLTSLQ